jgi:hypothetical protein
MNELEAELLALRSKEQLWQKYSEAMEKLLKQHTDARKSAFADAIQTCRNVKIARSFQGNAEGDPIDECISALENLK